jgi:hypothetical protein
MNRPFVRLAAGAAAALLIASFPACSRNKAEIRVFLINVPATMTINQSVSLTANVVNDDSSAGVDWTVSAGAIAPAHTGSGAAAVFTAPGSAGSVTVTATSTADGATKATAAITVVPIGSNSMLHGAYVFSVGGSDSSGSYAAAGVIVADGNGNITGGEQDYADESLQAGPDPVTGSYAIGPDGRGSITLSVDNANLPNNGFETFGIALTSSTHALIIQFDGTATSSGALEAQSASALDPAAIAGAFAFTAQGFDIVSRVLLTHGGVLTLDALAGTVTAGTYYVNDGGSTFSTATTGTISAPDGFGRGTLALSVSANFIYYAVQGQVLRLVENDFPYVTAAGLMAGQGPAGAAGTFANASLAGSYVLSGAGGSTYGPLALAGQFVADGSGAFTGGVADVNDAGVVTFASIIGTNRYAIASNGVGTLSLPRSVDQAAAVSSFVFFMVSPDVNLMDPTSSSGGGGALLMDYDVGALGSGSIVPQSAGTFEGNYAVNLQYATSAAESDWIGQAVAGGGILNGTVDVNDSGLTAAGLTLTGNYANDATNPGRFTGAFNANATSHTIVFYQVSDKALVVADLSATMVGIGVLGKQ